MTTAERVVIKAFPWVSLALIAAVIVIFFLMRSGAQTADTYLRDREINIRNAMAHKERADREKVISDSLRTELKQDRAEQAERGMEARKKIVLLNATVARLKASRKIAPDDTTRAIEAAYDSTVNAQAKEITTLTAEKSDMWGKFNEIMNLKDSENAGLREAIAGLQKVGEKDKAKIEEQAKKIGSQKKVITFLGGVSAVLTVVLALIIAF